ncbi:nucleoside 2-deoxyribosyltransferase [Pelagicoccus sp. SDUM812005]|uniref:nucleoside 2-deoxyribosyltransferase n=1 Tax=Pelagicoccus sp. SDUM812005 TaxID=3041257 RepID=UPI00281042E1|nr:nucleoside 2-deoxyribosyltransferase [Pelagicoccus sp. SDUM812005]MDQ8180061.1 nucleoside 2-deoxyribosyltransferase [Pelagicoccus sp. SDUM812005]
MDTKKVYLAGGLFDLRQLAGNAQLAECLESSSEGRYKVYLPQDYEPESLEAKAIRDSDFRGVLDCDAAVFQFDGTELDSGTVAEFMAAKFADIPAVALRTDFRRGGDRNEEPWNLMCSFYPRTVSLVVDAMQLYVESGHASFGGVEASRKATQRLAELLLGKLDEVVSLPPVAVEGANRREDLERLLGM